MSNWKCLPSNRGIHSVINSRFGGIKHPNRIVYPDLNDGSDHVLATDYYGEPEDTEFRVLGFLLTTLKSIESVWEPARLEVRSKHLHNNRRMSFKKLHDALRINAFPTFLKAASQLNGVLACVAIEKSFLIAAKDDLPPLQYDWVPGPLEKLLEICTFGAGLINGLRSPGQNVRWLTDDDAIVVKEAARAAASVLHEVLPLPCSFRDFLMSCGQVEQAFGGAVNSRSVTPGRRAARISSPSSSRRHARRLSAWLGRRGSSSHGDADRWPTNPSSARPHAHASVIVNAHRQTWNAPTLAHTNRTCC